MYRYETHTHTSPVSKCAKATVRETLEYYKNAGYDGIFLTNHFIDGNIGIDGSLPVKDRLDFYFSDYHEAKSLGEEMGIKVFLGVEISNETADFLIYGLPESWYYEHPDVSELYGRARVDAYFSEPSALVVQGHPFRQRKYIDHIRLYPQSVHAIETLNASDDEQAREMARLYAQNYGLLPFAGSDNHSAGNRTLFAGMEFDTPIESELDFAARIKNGEGRIFFIEKA